MKWFRKKTEEEKTQEELQNLTQELKDCNEILETNENLITAKYQEIEELKESNLKIKDYIEQMKNHFQINRKRYER